jgi:hypothetical protein
VELDYYWSRPPFTQHETLYKCPKRQALLRTFTQYDRFTFWDPFTDPEVPFDLEEEFRQTKRFIHYGPEIGQSIQVLER